MFCQVTQHIHRFQELTRDLSFVEGGGGGGGVEITLLPSICIYSKLGTKYIGCTVEHMLLHPGRFSVDGMLINKMTHVKLLTYRTVK